MSCRSKGFEQHEHVERQRRVDEFLEIGARQHAQDGEHATRARDATLEHLVTIDQEILAHAGHGQRRQRAATLLQVRERTVRNVRAR
jgi:hypothetical protein